MRVGSDYQVKVPPFDPGSFLRKLQVLVMEKAGV